MVVHAQLSALDVMTVADAPEQSRELLQTTQARMGLVPNMYGAMANVPAVLSTYLQGYDEFRRTTTFTPTEQEVVMLAISVFNDCSYCVAAHSTVADLSKVPRAVTDAVRDGKPVDDPRLQVLREFTTTLLATRGRPGVEDLQAYLAAGFTEKQVLELLLAIAVKTLSNYTNHLFGTPVDAFFASRTWASPSS
jgi:uncharacterized peroxidase-related enzyme